MVLAIANPVSIPAGSTAQFTYSCTGLTTTADTWKNHVEASWLEQGYLDADSAADTKDVAFTLDQVTDDCIAVSDTFNGGAPDQLATLWRTDLVAVNRELARAKLPPLDPGCAVATGCAAALQ